MIQFRALAGNPPSLICSFAPGPGDLNRKKSFQFENIGKLKLTPNVRSKKQLIFDSFAILTRKQMRAPSVELSGKGRKIN